MTTATAPSTIARVDLAFRIEDERPLPFARDIRAVLATPSAAQRVVPAFYDGEQTWRVRYLPAELGRHRLLRVEEWNEGHGSELACTLLDAPEFEVTELPRRGFVRRSATQPRLFEFENGDPFYPLGHNYAWAAEADYPRMFRLMAAAGENWSRVWMAHWAGLNIDWQMGRDLERGELTFEAIRRWDTIVEAAEANGINIQFVLQQHGQYSTYVNPIWDENPWNAARGGWLERPEQFFSDAEARRLTKIKYRYAVARWGYSPAVMAWELFNEVEYTNGYVREYVHNGAELIGLAAFGPKLAEHEKGAIVAWHREMAEYIRSIDPYRHLITTSSPPVTSPIWVAMDYYQLHTYTPDMLTAVSRFPNGIPGDKPLFYGEIGDHQIECELKADGRYMGPMMWAGLMSGGSGAAQVWDWLKVERVDLFAHYRSLAAFIAEARIPGRVFNPIECSLVPQDSDDSATSTSPLGVYAARCEADVIAWLFNRSGLHAGVGPARRGVLTLQGMPVGNYEAVWWDTLRGVPLSSGLGIRHQTETFTLETPDIRSDLALILRATE